MSVENNGFKSEPQKKRRLSKEAKKAILSIPFYGLSFFGFHTILNSHDARNEYFEANPAVSHAFETVNEFELQLSSNVYEGDYSGASDLLAKKSEEFERALKVLEPHDDKIPGININIGKGFVEGIVGISIGSALLGTARDDKIKK